MKLENIGNGGEKQVYHSLNKVKIFNWDLSL